MTTQLINHNSPVKLFSLARPLICENDMINRWKIDPNRRAKCVSCRQCFGKVDGELYSCNLNQN